MFLAAGTGIIALSSPSLVASFESQQARVSRSASLQRELEASEFEAQLRAQATALANSRYENGCLALVDAQTSIFIPITQNAIVVDRLNGNPLPPNVDVCDHVGGTGTTDADGRVINYAFTGDASIVRQFLDTSEGNLMLAGVHLENAVIDGGLK